MTTISPTHAALTILQQRTPGVSADKNASDAILDIVSRRTGAAHGTEAAAKSVPPSSEFKAPRAVGGSVSSAISSAHMSAMASAAHLEFKPIAAIVEHAEIFAGWLARDIDDYNGKFDTKKVWSREEYEAHVMAGEADRIAKGADVEAARKHTEFLLSDKLYNGYARHAELDNYWLIRNSNDAAYNLVNGAAQRFSHSFGVEVPISYDETGRARLGSFDVHYESGAKMLSYKEDCSMTSYNRDGTVREQLARARDMRDYIVA
ncbi:hypothetical protein [Ensifer sp.]|uniref:hypothetical protein n=1 Tax=Ensifer sp. TaxID=1872086 RepID=UPI002E123629|nr:hypothetical protein [Ensifer sp.]